MRPGNTSTAYHRDYRLDALLNSMTLYGTDREILKTALDWLETGHRPALVTVARTWGSSPRPVGSLMLMRDDGVYSGSVSGISPATLRKSP
jgi:xanthine dehydrogenase accessory factor